MAEPYQIWLIECDYCGDVYSAGEDESSIPESCGVCGRKYANDSD